MYVTCVPVPEDSQRYDRLTGYSNAGALALAAEGIEGIGRNDGRMGLMVECKLKAPDIGAKIQCEALRYQLRLCQVKRGPIRLRRPHRYAKGVPLSDCGAVTPMMSLPRSTSRISRHDWRVRTRTPSSQLTPSGSELAIPARVWTHQYARSPRTLYRALWIFAALIAARAPTLQAFEFGVVRLHDDAAAAFAEYIASADTQFERRLAGDSPFLWGKQDQARAKALARGKIVVDPTPIPNTRETPGGLIHDWTAALLVPHADAERLVAVVSAYDTHADTYGPGVLHSQILERDGTRMRVAMRLLKKNVLTAVLETEHTVEFDRLDSQRWWGRSESTSIREVVRRGKPDESLRPPGHDRGFLWRMVVYWRFADTPEGAIVEHRSISMTRSPPKGLRWVLRPVLDGLPRQSLANILSITSDAALVP